MHAIHLMLLLLGAWRSGSPIPDPAPSRLAESPMVAVSFIIFDVELVFRFPGSVVLRVLGW